MTVRRNLRLRVASGTAAVAMAIVVVHSALILSGFEQLENALIDGLVSEQLQNFIVNYRANPADPPLVPERLTAFIVNDEPSRKALPENLRDLPPGVHDDLIVGGREHHVAIRDEPEGRFVMMYDTTEHDEREADFVLMLVAGLGVTLVAASALGYWATGRLVRPVQDLAQRVASLDAGPSPVPLEREFFDADVRRLARAFDGYRQKVADFIHREQEFTANVSHELRTPLTSIRTSCELLLQGSGLTVDDRRRVQSIDRAAERLTSAAQSLLYLARGGGPPRLEEVSVRECVEEAAEPVRGLLAQKQLAFEIAIHPAAVVRADWHALYLVASNLLRNAALYTDQGGVKIAYLDGALTFEDSGPGIEPSAIPHVFERFNRGNVAAEREGLGLGLSIVRRICEAFDWHLELSSTPGRGTRVTVRFPLPDSREIHGLPTAS